MENTITEMFEEQLTADPDAVCIIEEDRSLSRREFSELIDAICCRLPKEPGRIGIIMEHSAEMIASVFAVLKGGGTYVPVEPFFPKKRIEFMMEDAGVEVIITSDDLREKAGDVPVITVERGMKTSGETCEDRSKPEGLAYILYTSGSTGAPKGVAVRNENVCHYIRAFLNEFHPGPGDVMLQYSVCSFDIFVEEIFTSICSGAALAIPSEETKNDIGRLMEFADKNNVTIISGFPYLLLELNELPEIPGSLRLLISGGDVLRAAYVSNLTDKVEVYNTYGPSETTVCASYFRCSGADPLADGTYPVGKPVQGTEIIILDDHLAPVDSGEAGEICILGGGVSSGYIGNRRKENEAFVAWDDGKTLYRSGDLGYFLPDGNIAFLHRKDTQIMILGKRVEPAEVESVLISCPEIKTASVRPCTDEHNLSYMTAYIVLNQEKASLATLKKEMARFLPKYMIPEFFVQMKEMPLNANGKIDTAALPVILK